MGKIKYNKGFTLIEMLVVGITSVIIFGGVINLLIASDEVTDDTVQNGELQEIGTYALNVISEDLMMAGYFGEQSSKDSDLGYLVEGGYANLNNSAVADDCVGDGGNNGTFPLGNGFVFRYLWATQSEGVDEFNCIASSKANSTILQIKRGLGEDVSNNDSPNTITDHKGIRYYMLTIEDSVEIYHGNNANIGTGDLTACDATTDVTNCAMEYQHYIYYVREQTQGDIKVPILARMQLEKDAEDDAEAGKMVSYDLAEGVEYINVLFGVDDDGDNVADFYLGSEKMEAAREYWDQATPVSIVSAKLYVLVRSIKPDNRVENNASYNMGDHNIDAGGDGYRRMLFTNTVNIVNSGEKRW